MRRHLNRAGLVFFAAIFLSVTIFGCVGTTAVRKSSKTKTIPITIYKSAAIDIRSANIEKIAIAPFESKLSDKDDLGTKVADMFFKKLSETMIYTVKSPNEVSSDLLVNGLAIKPYMEKTELQKVGEALKVDAFFLGELKKREIVNKAYTKTETIQEETGEGEFVTNDEGKLVFKQKTKPVNVDMECRSGVGEVSIRYVLYNAKTGNVIFDRIESLSEEVEAFCYRANLNPDEMSPEEIEALLDEVTMDLTDKFVALLTPPSNTELVIFENLTGVDNFSKNLLELGIDNAKMGDWAKAIEHLKQCRDRNRDNAEAHYNLGIAYQGYGMLEKALYEVLDAQKRKSKKLYSNAIRQIKLQIEKNKDKDS